MTQVHMTASSMMIVSLAPLLNNNENDKDKKQKCTLLIYFIQNYTQPRREGVVL
jgi:hypothetical protein